MNNAFIPIADSIDFLAYDISYNETNIWSHK